MTKVLLIEKNDGTREQVHVVEEKEEEKTANDSKLAFLIIMGFVMLGTILITELTKHGVLPLGAKESASVSSPREAQRAPVLVPVDNNPLVPAEQPVLTVRRHRNSMPKANTHGTTTWHNGVPTGRATAAEWEEIFRLKSLSARSEKEQDRLRHLQQIAIGPGKAP